MKTILGLDLGTNSIGWALIKQDFENKQGEILGMGSRIIPTNPEMLSRFSSGQPLSKANAGQSYTPTGKRTDFRGIRHLLERDLLRRERLHRVLNIMGFLPKHYSDEIDFEQRLGQFKTGKEPKIAYRKNLDGKFEFIFQESFQEMVADFRETQPQLFYIKSNGEETKIPYDWTIYYLRKKALSKKITKEELAWILLNFNQKRGYYQLRGEEEEAEDNKEKSFETLQVSRIEDSGEKIKGKNLTLYDVYFENGWKYDRQIVKPEDWLGKTKEFIVTTSTQSSGEIKRTFKAVDSEQDWIAIKQKTEQNIYVSGKTVGEYIYDTLLQKPNQKIRGKLIRTIERKLYKDELEQILNKQIELQSELFTDDKLNDCIRELYKNNIEHQNELSDKNFIDLFVADIIFYQRPLRSQKSNIGTCRLEFREHKINKKDEKGNPIKNVFEKDINGKDITVKEYLKGIPKSNPYFQEFRIWQWLYNLKIYTRDDDKNVTNEFIKNVTDLENLFAFLMTKKEVSNKDIVEYLIKDGYKNSIETELRELFPKLNDEKIHAKVASKLKDKVKELLPKYRWNYVFDNSKEKEEDKSKKYPCNSTGYEIRRRLETVANVHKDFLSKEQEYRLWHIIYSVKDEIEFKKALGTFAEKNDLDKTTFVENFRNFKPFKSEYGSFSEKAIKKLLPLMRLGKYWDANEITEDVKVRAISIKERLDSVGNEEDIESVADDDIPIQILKSFFKLKDADTINFIQGLQLYQASYLVYGRHSESEVSDRWKMSYDIQEYLYDFKQHSLRNPIVEQVVTETLRVVKDIWEREAEKNNVQEPIMVYDEHKKREVKSYPKVFDEIHIELGREMKNTAEDRKAITNNVLNNEATNLRIKKMLLEFSQDDDFKNEKGENTVRPYSPMQLDILKIFEDDILSQYSEQELKNEIFEKTAKDEAKNIFELSRKSEPTKAEIIRYKLWLEQKYRSPYTGEVIPLGKLFTPAYEIEHIIPQSRYFDDSYNNKVICEAEVNLLKGNQLGLQFIKDKYGQKVQIGQRTVTIFTEDQYKNFVTQHYKNSNKKRKNLLLEEIPDKMIERQLNDTRYISRFISKLLSNIVRNDENDNGINSTNLIPVTGAITSKLKQSWGLNDKWNELILPRFKRLNNLKDTTIFTAINKEGHTIPAIPLGLSKGFQFKRIDHRHHALDALVIACATRDHVQYLNNENAKSQKFHLQKGLAKKLREFERVEIRKMEQIDEIWKESKQCEIREIPKSYFKPWDNFATDAKKELEKIVVSFKSNSRVINKTVNYYEHYVNGNKTIDKQTKGDSWAIRKSLHKDTVFGEVNLKKTKEIQFDEALKNPKLIVEKDLKNKIIELQEHNLDNKKIKKYFEDNKDVWNDINLKKIKIYYFTKDILDPVTKKPKERYFATRKELGSIFKDDKGKFKEIDKVVTIIKESLTDTGIQKILLAHLNLKNNNPEMAFSPEGIEDMNKNILELNGGKPHQPIFKVRWYEKADKFEVGHKGNKANKFVEAAKGTNLFFAIYVDSEGNRSYETMPLNLVIERQKHGLSSCPEVNEKGHRLLFDLSPDDLVYVPTIEEQENPNSVDFKNLTKEQVNRIFVVNDFSGVTIYFTPNSFAKNIAPKELDTSFDSKQSKINEILIKETCWKLEVNRIGEIYTLTEKDMRERFDKFKE